MEIIIAMTISALVLVLLLPIRRKSALMQLRTFRNTKSQSRTADIENKAVRMLVKHARWTRKIYPVKLDRLKAERLREQLSYAGFSAYIRPEDFVQMRWNIALFCLFYFGLQYVKTMDSFNLVAVVLCPIMGYFIPAQWLHGKVKNRKTEIRKNVPYVLSLFAILTEAGLNITQSMEEVGKNAKNPLTEEIQKTAEDIQMGSSPKLAFEALAQRADVEEINYFVSSLIQGLEKGSAGISEIIKMHARESWDSRKALAKELAEKASMRLFMPLLFLVLPAMIIFLLGPMFFSMVDMFQSGV